MSYFFLFVFPFFFLNSVCLPRKINVLLRFKNRFWRRQTRIGLASGSQTQFTWWRLKPLEILLHSSMHAERFRCISNWNILNLCDSLTLVFTSDASTSASIYDILVKWKQTVDASISRRRREERFTSAMLFSVARPIWWHGVPFLLNYFPSHYQHWLMVIPIFCFSTLGIDFHILVVWIQIDEPSCLFAYSKWWLLCQILAACTQDDTAAQSVPRCFSDHHWGRARRGTQSRLGPLYGTKRCLCCWGTYVNSWRKQQCLELWRKLLVSLHVEKQWRLYYV